MNHDGHLLAIKLRFILVSSQCVYGMTLGNIWSSGSIIKILMQVVDDGCSIWNCILRIEAWTFHQSLYPKYRKIKTAMHLLQTTIASSYSVAIPSMILLKHVLQSLSCFLSALKQKWGGCSAYTIFICYMCFSDNSGKSQADDDDKQPVHHRRRTIGNGTSYLMLKRPHGTCLN